MTPARLAAAVISFALSIVFGSARAAAQTPAQAGELGLPQLLELSQLADLLEAHAPAAPGNWAIVEQAHAEYATRYEQVFRRELEAANVRPDAWDPSSMGRWTSSHDAISRKLLGLESALLDAIRPAVDETKLGGLERVRRRRACSWQQGSFRSLGVDAVYTYDISTAIHALEACQSHRQSLTPTLESYESARARDLGEFFAAIMKASAKFSAAYESMQGEFQEDAGLTPEQRAAAYEQLQRGMNQIAESVKPSFRELSARQHRALESIESQLPLDVRRLVVDRFVSEAYSIGEPESQGVPGKVRRALRLRSLTELERDEVRRIDVSWWTADRAACRELMDLEDERTSNWMYFDDEVWNEIAHRQHAVQTRREKRTEQAMAELASLLGDERAQSLTGAEDPAIFSEAPLPGGGSGSTVVDQASPMEQDQSPWNMKAIDAVVPPSPEFRAFLERRMASDPTGAVVVEVLWPDLLEAWAREVGTPWKEAIEEADHDVVWGPEGPVIDPSVPARASARIDAALQQERTLLAAFVEELRATVPALSADSAALAMAWVDLEQVRVAVGVLRDLEGPPLPVNAVRIAESAAAAVAAAELDGMLRPGSVGIVDSARVAQRHARDLWRLLQQLEVDSALTSQAGVWDSPEIRAQEEKKSQMARILRESCAVLHARTNEALSTVRARLDADGQSALDRAALRDADGWAVGAMPNAVTLIDAALAAMAPDDQRRSALDSAIAEFRSAHEQCADAVIAARARFPRPRWDGLAAQSADDVRATQEQFIRRRAELAQATDAVRHHSQRVLMRLESILGQDATRALPGYKRMKRLYIDDGGLGWVAW